VFFVDSGASRAADANAGRDPNVPLATIDAAVARCTANNGDMIVVMPGHDENPTADIAMDVAGVWIYGLGWGNDRPTVTFGALGASVTMSAASTRLSNIIFDLGTVATTVTAPITITGSGCIVEGCETRPHASSQFTSLISVGADANDVVIRDNVLRCLSTGASSTSGILLDGCDRITIVNNHIDGFFAEHVIDNTTGSLDEILDCLIANNYLKQVGSGTDLVVEMDANATGLLISNMMSGTQALDANVTPGNVRCIDNYLADADDTHGVVVPTTAAA
jgi:hypothetical protein